MMNENNHALKSHGMFANEQTFHQVYVKINYRAVDKDRMVREVGNLTIIFVADLSYGSGYLETYT